jgi:hypothetical protein
MPKPLRYLRIAWSVMWAILCLLLVALWVRSYWRHDFICFYGRTNIGIESQQGNLLPFVQQFGGAEGKWKFNSTPSDPASPTFRHPAFTWNNQLPSYFFTAIPHWFISVCAAVFAAVPWIRWRYRLRTLLIAMTLVAVALGAIVLSIQ